MWEVLRKCWESHDKVLRRSWENTEKILRKFWESPERELRQSWKSSEKVLRKCWESWQRVQNKSWESPEKFLRNSWKSHKRVVRYFTHIKLQTCLFLSLQLDDEFSLRWYQDHGFVWKANAIQHDRVSVLNRVTLACILKGYIWPYIPSWVLIRSYGI